MVQAMLSAQAWKPEDSREAQENYREASGGKTHERWIQGSVTSVRAISISRRYESRDGGIFVRPAIIPQLSEDFAAWQAASAAAFRLFEDILHDPE